MAQVCVVDQASIKVDRYTTSLHGTGMVTWQVSRFDRYTPSHRYALLTRQMSRQTGTQHNMTQVSAADQVSVEDVHNITWQVCAVDHASVKADRCITQHGTAICS